MPRRMEVLSLCRDDEFGGHQRRCGLVFDLVSMDRTVRIQFESVSAQSDPVDSGHFGVPDVCTVAICFGIMTAAQSTGHRVNHDVGGRGDREVHGDRVHDDLLCYGGALL